MPYLPTLPRRTPLERVSLAFAGLLALIGIATVLCSSAHVDFTVAGWGSAAGLEEGIGISLLGASLLARESGWRPIEWIALLVVAIAGRNLAGAYTGGAYAAEGLTASTFSEVTAICFGIGGAAVAWHAGRPRSSMALRRLIEAALGSAIAAVGIVALFGYAANLGSLTTWGSSNPVPATTSVALLVFGAALVLLAWREATQSEREPTWAPVVAIAACLTLTLILWAGVREHELQNLQFRTQTEANQLVGAAEATISTQESTLGRIAQRWSTVENESEDLWNADAASYFPDMRNAGCVSIAYVNSYLRTQRIYPADPAAITFDHNSDTVRASAINRALKEGEAVSGSIYISGQRNLPGFAIYAQIQHAGAPATFAAAEYLYQALFGSIAVDQLKIANDYKIVASIVGATVFENSVAAASDPRMAFDNNYDFFDRSLHLTVIPSDAMVREQKSLPQLVLGVGVLISALMGLTVQLFLRARAGQRTSELSNQRLRSEIEERRRIEVQLKQAKSDAEAGSRAKSEFLASMSHEIRTPMNGVIGMASLMMETKLTAEQRDYVNTIRASGDALLEIINEILDFSKIESGKMEIEHQPFDLVRCVEETLDLFGVQAAAKRLELGCHIAADVPSSIVGDVTRVRQVIANLINNAIKFTPSGSVSLIVERTELPAPPPPPKPVLTSRSREDDEEEEEEPIVPKPPPRYDPELNPKLIALEFIIRDTGIGIPPDRMNRLFKAFSQVDSSTTRKYGGTGLGLAICQRLCELMGGGIRVESVAGRGSAFIFTILTEPAQAASPAEPVPPLPGALRTGPVLCVEDLPVNQARLRTIFESWGAACFIAADAASAKVVAANLPAPTALLVVEDDGTAEPSPLEVLAYLSCPRLVMFPFGQTAPTPPSAGAPYGSISKPIKPILLMQAVASLFGPKRQEIRVVAVPNDRPLAEEFPLEVLLAEDNAVNQKVALRFLERLGYRADVANNGREALNLVELRRYDLVLMDMQMPEMDGLEASRQIRRRLAPDRQPKILALTANAMKGDRELCIAAGMDDHLSKPIKMEEIAGAIRRHFATKAVPAKS